MEDSASASLPPFVLVAVPLYLFLRFISILKANFTERKGVMLSSIC